MIDKASFLTKKEKIVVYVDGFNLYFGMKSAGWDKFKWLNIKKLIIELLKPNQELATIKYFTSRVGNNPDKQKRQSTYIEALETVGVEVFYGHYQSDTVICSRCGNIWPKYNEKMTDVNIATQMLVDAYQDRYDTAMLISGDSDLVPPIKAIHENFASKRVFILFPPKRFNNSMSLVAKGSMTLGRKKIADSQFDAFVRKPDGFMLEKPAEW